MLVINVPCIRFNIHENNTNSPLGIDGVIHLTTHVSTQRFALGSPFEDTMHYNDVIMGTMASQIASLTIVYSTVYLGADQRKHQSYASLAFVRGMHQWPVNSSHKWPVTWKMFPFDDVIMVLINIASLIINQRQTIAGLFWIGD